MRWSALLLLVVSLACTRSSPSTHVVVTVPSAPPAISTSVPAPSTSALPKTYSSGLAMIGGDLVDLDVMTVLRPLSKDTPFASTVTDDTAYLWHHGDLEAIDVASGVMRWSKPIPSCWQIEASRAGVFCGTDAGARFFEKKAGNDSIVGAPTGISGLARIGARVLAVHSDKTLQALDEKGAVVGSVVLPFSPSSGWTRNVLSVAGALACGVEGSDTGTSILCVDATPSLVWKRVSAVPRGILQQADDVLLVTSDTWSKTGGSEVLKTSDGTSLLRMPTVKLGAALSTAGVFDGALAPLPNVTYFDAKGTAKWTWAGPPFHDETMHAVRSGSAIVFAQHSPIATGVRLVALDESTGALAWQGNVDSLPISHSKYSNRVELRKTGKSVLLLGRESSQEYAQTFDPATGKRLVSILRGR